MAEFSAKAGKTRHARLTLDERFRLRSQSEVMVVGGKVGRGTKDEGRFGVYNKKLLETSASLVACSTYIAWQHGRRAPQDHPKWSNCHNLACICRHQ